VRSVAPNSVLWGFSFALVFEIGYFFLISIKDKVKWQAMLVEGKPQALLTP
jgi:hypothetical protein